MNRVTAQPATPPWPRRHLFWVVPLLVLVVWASADISRLFSIATTDDASVVWPPIGIALAAALSLGYRVVPVYGVLVAVWFAGRGYAPDIFVLMAIEQGGALAAMTFVSQRFVREIPLLATLGGALRFYFLVTVLSLLPFAGLATLAYYRMGYFPELGYINIWVFHWLSEAMGVVLFAPPTLMLLEWLKQPRKPSLQRLDAVFWVAFVLLLAASLAAGVTGHFNYARGLAYLFFPLLIAGALGGRVFTALAMLPLAVMCTVLGVYFGTWQTNMAAWNALGEALAFSAVLGIITQLVVASTVERTRLIDYLREINHRDQLTGDLNRRGLIERLERQPEPESDHSRIAATLCLRNFAHARELLSDQLVDDCEHWVLNRIRVDLSVAGLAPLLARVDNGVYAMVLAAPDIGMARRRLSGLVYGIKGTSFAAEGSQYQVEPTIGALPFRAGESVADVLTATFHMAREAMNTPGQPLHFGRDYQELLDAHRNDLRRLEAFKRALNHDGLLLFGQRIQPLDGERLHTKVEFLVRMKGEHGEVVSPGAFMPVASRFGYMADLDRWVIRNAFQAVADQPALLNEIGQFSINLSGATLSDPQAVEHIRSSLRLSELPAERFCFEVTETEQVEDWDRALDVLQGIKAMGFAVSLDDFGTGLASFDYLNRFDFDYVKIDGSFVRALDTEARNREVVEAVVLVAERRGIRTIAEFVENEAIIAELDRLNVDYVQGFGVHRPEPVSGLQGPDASAPAST